MKRYYAVALLLVAAIVLSSINVAFSGTGIVMSGKVSSISKPITPQSTVRVIRINDANFFVDEKAIVTLGTVNPVNRYAFNLRIGDNVIVIAEDDGGSYPTARLIILMPSP